MEDLIKRYRVLLSNLAILVAVAVGGIIFVLNYRSKKNEEAQAAMFRAVYQFEAGKFDKALAGDKEYQGLLSIIKQYSATKAGNLAKYYAGVSYVQKKEYAKALEYLKKFNASDYLLQAKAWELIGDVYSEQEQYKEAASYYEKAANYKSNPAFTPMYLLKQALVFEKLKHFTHALNCYEKIMKEYPKSASYRQACQYKSRVEGLMAKPKK